MANTQLDTLTITLNAEVGNAKRNLNGVATSLKNLEEVGKNADWKVFDKIKKHLQGIADIDFTNVASSLRDVVSALKATGFSKKSDIDKALTSPKVSLDEADIAVEPDWITNFGKMQKQLLKKDFEEQLGSYKRTFADIVANASNLKDITFNLKTEWEQATTSFEKVKVLISSIKDGLKQSSIFTGDTVEKTRKLAMSVKRIGLYRLVRFLIKAVVNAVKQAISNLYSYFDSINGAYAETLDDLKSSYVYFINSIGVAFKPIITFVSQALSGVLTILGDIFNLIADITQTISGSFDMTNAEKSLVKFKNATKSLGIDELNVIGENNGLFSNLFGDPTQLDAMSQTIKDLFDSIRPIFDTIKEVLPTILEPLSKIIAQFWQLISKVPNSLLSNIANIISIILKAVGTIFEFVGEILNAISETGLTMYDPMIDFLDIVIQALGAIIQMLSSGVVGVIKTIIEFLKAVGETIKLVVTGRTEELGKVWENLGNKIKGIWVGVVNFLIDALNVVIHALERVINFFVKDVAGTIIGWFGVDTSNWGVSWEGISHISYATGGFPEDGLFFANHNELVGQFSNGKTAVANNEQITEGIYEAVLQAMQDSNSGAGNSGDIVLQLDGKEVARVSKKYNALEGNQIMKGGFKYGY